jgi:hypothetical protein
MLVAHIHQQGRYYVTKSDEDAYVYESPDGGKTMTRRRFSDSAKEVRSSRGNWTSIQELGVLVDVLSEEVELREKYPAVRAAWDNYQLLVKLAKIGGIDDE